MFLFSMHSFILPSCYVLILDRLYYLHAMYEYLIVYIAFMQRINT